MQFRWQAVPQTWTSDRKISVTETGVCSRDDTSVNIRRPQHATTGVGDDKLTVVHEVRRREIMKCFVDQRRQLEIDTLTYWKPVM